MSDGSALEGLLRLQDEDTAVERLRHRRGHLPERTALAEHEQAVAAVEAERDRVEATRDERAKELRRLQGDVATIEARIAEIERAMKAVGAARELEALQHEQASLGRRQDQLETDELEIMEELDPLEEQRAALAGRLEALADEGEALATALTAAEVAVEEELTAVLARREEALAALDADLLATYDRLRERLGGVAVARLTGNVCGGCHLTLSAVEVDRIRREPPDALVHCDECGRLLVR